MADEPNEEKSAPSGGGKKKLLLFSSAGLVVIIAAAFLFATFAIPAPPADEQSGADGGGAGDGTVGTTQEIYDLPVIMVNIKNTNKKRILKVHLNIVYETKSPETSAGLFDDKLPEIKDALTTMLTEKTLDQLEGKDDLIMLRMELMDEIERVVFADEDGKVLKVYYEEFIVQ